VEPRVLRPEGPHEAPPPLALPSQPADGRPLQLRRSRDRPRSAARSPYAADLAGLVEGWYESEELDQIAEVLRPDDVVLELGTGLGFVSTYAARQPGVRRVVTVEANTRLVEIARYNHCLNGARVEAINAVVAAEDGTTTFYLHEDFWISSMAPQPGTAPVRLPARSISGLLAEVRPTVLVVDIEGGEASIFEGVGLPLAWRVNALVPLDDGMSCAAIAKVMLPDDAPGIVCIKRTGSRGWRASAMRAVHVAIALESGQTRCRVKLHSIPATFKGFGFWRDQGYHARWHRAPTSKYSPKRRL
jgi:FkbM family methyltransferase